VGTPLGKTQKRFFPFGFKYKKSYLMQENKYLSAIVVVKSENSIAFKKYRNIRNDPAALSRFERHAKQKFDGSHYVNYYAKDSSFVFRRYI
jgi:hypothetical protein